MDRIGDAGVATVNLAVDSVDDRKELPKALDPIRPYFEYLLKNQYVYGCSVFFNINITRTNLEEVRRLTEIAHDVGMATDYHINETPVLEQPTSGTNPAIARTSQRRIGRRSTRPSTGSSRRTLRPQDGELSPAAG